MHVETEQRDVRHCERVTCGIECLIERDAELVSPLARARVMVRRVDLHFRIHPQRDGARSPHAPRDRRSAARSSNTDSTLNIRMSARAAPRAAPLATCPTPLNTMESALNPARSARNSSPPDTMSTPAPRSCSSAQQREIRVGLHAVVQAVRHRRERAIERDRTARESRARCRRRPACRPRSRSSSGTPSHISSPLAVRANPGAVSTLSPTVPRRWKVRRT